MPSRRPVHSTVCILEGRRDHRGFVNKPSATSASLEWISDFQPRSGVGVSLHLSLRHSGFILFERQHGKIGRDQPADA